MTQTCTSTLNDVVRYIFNETSDSENQFIETVIVKDNSLLDFYLDCISIKKNLDELELCPNDKVINKILEYSKNFEPTIIS